MTPGAPDVFAAVRSEVDAAVGADTPERVTEQVKHALQEALRRVTRALAYHD